MGATQSSDKSGISIYASDPATYLAGLAVRLASTGLLSLTKSAGNFAGVSLGKSLSDHKKTSVIRAGSAVPVLLERQPARGEIEITDYAALVDGTDDTVTVGATAFTAQTGSVSHGGATFQAATGNEETAISLADQINYHATAGLLVRATVADDGVTVILTAVSNSTSGDTIALSYAQLGAGVGATVSGATLTDSDDSADYVQIGAFAYFSDTTGKADDPNSGATISNAVYVSDVMVGIDEGGSNVAIALVDMIGGL